MKNVLRIALPMLFAAAIAGAQPATPSASGGQQEAGNFNAGTPGQRAQRYIDGPILRTLNLTADQKTKAALILTDLNKSLDALTASVPQNASDRQAQLTALQPKIIALTGDSEKKFTVLLTADQKKAYAVIVKSRPAAQGFGQQNRGGGRGPTPVGTVTTSPDAHDPVMIKEGDTYYIYYTNGGLSSWSTKDMVNFRKEPPVFTTPQAWIKEAMPGFRGGVGFWAPDITLHNGKYYLYYSVSGFGGNNSLIGLVTNTTLNPESPNYKWVDEGKVVQSVPGRDMWNAIDPNLIFDEKGEPWLDFGSWWNGIKMVKLNSDLKTISFPEQWLTIASRGRDILKLPDSKAGERINAIEGPFIFKKDKYFYLFTSWGRCCTTVDSVTYNIRIGRSEKATGPYFDKDGVDLARGGGTLLLGGDTGPEKVRYALGHNSTYTFNGVDYLVFHAYTREGSKLGIEKLAWDNGWPVVVPKKKD